MKKTTCYSLLFFILMLNITTLVYAQENITIATHDYPPYYDATGTGMFTEIYQAAFKTEGIGVTIKVFPIKRGVQYLLLNKVDAHSPGQLFFAEAHQKKITSVPVYKIIASCYHYKPLQKKTGFTSLESIKDFKLGIIVSSPYLPLYEQLRLNTNQVETPAQLVRMAKAGRHEFFESTFLSGLILINGLYPDEMNNFSFFTWDTIEAGLAFLNSSKRSMALKDKFKSGFATINQNGTYIKILESYWGKNNIPVQVLPDTLKQHGISELNMELFQSYKRNDHGRITQP